MEKLVDKLKQDYPSLTFLEGEQAHWSPKDATVTYSRASAKTGIWTLFHELGHALCGHQDYTNDIDLLKKEAEAWERAQKVALPYGTEISKDHIENCLDTYRDWLHKRSSCPGCDTHGLQRSKALYYCPNCQTTWKVSSARFCRPYRLKEAPAAN